MRPIVTHAPLPSAHLGLLADVCLRDPSLWREPSRRPSWVPDVPALQPEVPKHYWRRDHGLWLPVSCLVTEVQTVRAAVSGSSPQSTGDFPGGCTAGNTIIVVVRTANNPPIEFADTLGTTYAQAVAQTSIDPRLTVAYGVLEASGTNAITLETDSPEGFGTAWAFAIEVSGLATVSALDVADGISGAGGISDLVSNPFTTTEAVEYILAAASQSNFLVYSAGADFTLLDGQLPNGGGGSDYGGVQSYITSGILSSYTAHITSTGTEQYSMVTVSFKAATGGGPSLAKIIFRNRLYV